MRTDKLLDQLETYSNAIVGFMIAHSGLGTALAVTAIYYLSRQIQRLSSENTELVRVVFHAKAGAVVLFTLIPIALLIAFGVYRVQGTGRCAAPVKAALILSTPVWPDPSYIDSCLHTDFAGKEALFRHRRPVAHTGKTASTNT